MRKHYGHNIKLEDFLSEISGTYLKIIVPLQIVFSTGNRICRNINLLNGVYNAGLNLEFIFFSQTGCRKKTKQPCIFQGN